MLTFKQFLVEEGPVISPAPLVRSKRPPLADGGVDRARSMINMALNNDDRGVKRLMAVQDGKVVGAISYYPNQRRWIIDRVGSLQKGIGSLLVKHVIGLAKAAGASMVVLWATDTSDSFYGQFGFKDEQDPKDPKAQLYKVLHLQPESRGVYPASSVLQ